MAKFRFPGKALKLSYRKRVKFRFGNELNSDEQRVIQIKSGLILFNQLFGESDEDDEFDGFGGPELSKSVNKQKKIENKTVIGRVEIRCDFKEACSVSESVDEENIPSISLVNGLDETESTQEAVILEQKNNSNPDDEKTKEDFQLSKVSSEKVNSKKVVKESTTTERTSKLFVLPMVSARSSRIIKPNKRLFSDFTSLYSPNQQTEESKPDQTEKSSEIAVVESSKVIDKVKNADLESDNSNPAEEKESDPVCRSITFYTDSITEAFKNQVGRPPKRLLRRGETQSKEEFGSSLTTNPSPSKDLKEDKVKEKIEKLLRSPWDSRIKQNSKSVCKDKDRTSITIPFSNAKISKSILRKARLNLNKQTLQKIRSPASVQRLVPLSEEETAESKCGLCQSSSCNTICRYGVSCCETCHLSINYYTEGPPSSLECTGGQGECQLVGLSIEERCMACWLSRILLTCAMPSLLHDRLRKRLPSPLKEKVPTSLGRSFNVNSLLPEDEVCDGGKMFSVDYGAVGFGSHIDLPGGWKRKNGSDVVVISPSGEKFRSIAKLEEFLKRQGINAQASVLFGNLNSKTISNSESKSLSGKPSKPPNKVNNVVVMTLPGGWTRRVKWRNTGDRFDTYVCSPDGRTFRSSRELSAYFQHIGKIDDIHKYFPVKNSAASRANSSENSEASSTEPVSSSDGCSEGSTDEKSVYESESEEENVPETEVQGTCQGNDELSDNHSEKTLFNKALEGDTVLNSCEELNSLNKTSETLIISNLNNQLELSSGDLDESKQKSDMSSQNDEVSSSMECSKHSEKEGSSLSDSEPRDNVAGVNLKMFKKSHKHKKSKKKSKKDDKIVLKINKKSLNPPSLDSGKEAVASKHKKKKKKRKRERHGKEETDAEKSKESEATYPLICDVDKISTKVTEKSNSLVTGSDVGLPLPDRSGGAQNNINFFEDVPLSPVLCHPNDTWQTLISQSIPIALEEPKTKDISVDKVLEEPVLENTLSKELNISNKLPPVSKPKQKKVCKKIVKLSGFTTQHFGSGWGRKIKWNEKGQGKVSFLTSPDGQKIVSSIELLAYFKKAGKTMLNMDYYFPKDLVRELPKEEEKKEPAQTAPSSQEALQRLAPTLTIKEKIEERKKERKILYKQAKGKFAKKSLKLCSVNRVKLKMTTKSNGNDTTTENKGILTELDVSANGDDPRLASDGGPRVKHVCRSQAQVLGMPRAVFPSPKNEKTPLKKKVLYSGKKSKFISVSTPKGKRILKKTLWCNKCPGCTTPNCKVCVNCLDMKKHGGPGTKKKPCVMRKCYNPLRAVKETPEAICVTPPHGEPAAAAGEDGDKNERTRESSLHEAETSVEHVSTINVVASLHSCDRDTDVDLMSDSVEERRQGDEDEEEEFELDDHDMNSPEKSIFVPMMMKPSVEAKDKCDIQAGKECIPGTRVNIDYWQAYDADEMLISGFPIITSVPLQIDSFCFRCGSAGMEQLLYCIWCCEGVHPFCLEEGEGPDNDEEEALWVCRKCAVCYVCGGSGHYDLLQCSGCKRHYHIECLGPSSHVSCQPGQDGIWLCVSCIKCCGCGSPNVIEWVEKEKRDEHLSPTQVREIFPNLRPFCERCLELRNSKNFCPICQGCYEDDDFDSKMMECGRCKEWVHAQCEGLTDEWYQILSYLPDSVEFVCKLCLHDGSSLWMEAIKCELQSGIEAIINVLIGSKCAKHLVHIVAKGGLMSKSVSAFSDSRNSKGKKGEVYSAINKEKEALKMEKERVSFENSVTMLECESKVSAAPLHNFSKDGCCGTGKESNTHAVRENSVPSSENSEVGLLLIESSLSSNIEASSTVQENKNASGISVLNFERPQTRSYKASSSIKEESDCPSKEGPKSLPTAIDDISLRKCSVRLEDICKIKGRVSNVATKNCTAVANNLSDTPRNPLMQDADNSSKVHVSSEDPIICSNNQNVGADKVIDNTTLQDKKMNTISKLSKSILSVKKNFKPSSYLSDLEEDEIEVKKKDKNSPYSLVAKVSKDIDDDCLSSEESSFCSSDTELESIFDDPDEPKDLKDIKTKISEQKFKSVLQFHVDVTRVLESGRNLNKAQTRNAKATYCKQMKERFPWFNVRQPNIFLLIDSSHPFPQPYSDHNYSDLKFNERTANSPSWGRYLPSKLKVSPYKSPKCAVKSPCLSLKSANPNVSSFVDPRKCLLCNVNGDAEPNGSGRLLYLGQDEWLHVNCGLWSSEVYEEEDGGLQNAYVAVSRGRQIKCSICQERGATVGCCHKSCQATYHFMCAKNSGCFFGEDKRIFCKSHLIPDETLKQIEDLRVGRCVFVNMDSEKKRWKQAITNKVNVVIGSLSIMSLGRMVPDIDFEDALIPAEFTCTRMYWSTKDPTKRVKYSCRTKVVRPTENGWDGTCAAVFHKTIDHSMGMELIQKEIAEVRAWQKERERQMWARQSRQTNIIPPHMCPLYRDILRAERKRVKKKGSTSNAATFPPPTRRQLFSSLSSSALVHDDDDGEEEVEEVRSCVESLLNQISRSEKENESPETLVPTSILPLDENDIHLPSADENNEIMTSIVNADDNEIISMVLRDLAVFESSALQSTPSTSGRPSPLDLDFLEACDPGIHSDEKLNDGCGSYELDQKSLNNMQENETLGESSVSVSPDNVAKSFLEDDDDASEAQLICQKILEACDPQIQNHLLTLEQNHSNTGDIHSMIPPESLHQQTYLHSDIGPCSLSEMKHSYQSVSSKVPPVEMSSQSPVIQQGFELMPDNICKPTLNKVSTKQFIHELDANSSYYNNLHAGKNDSSLPPISEYPLSVPSDRLVSSCPSNEFKELLFETKTHSNTLDSAEPSNDKLVSQCGESNELQGDCPNLLNSISTGELIEGKDKMSFFHQNCFENVHMKKDEPEMHPLQSFCKESPIPSSTISFGPPPVPSLLSHITSSSGTCLTSSSSKKQVCRVLPMLSSSVGSRRASSASDQSDVGALPVLGAEANLVTTDIEVRNEESCSKTKQPPPAVEEEQVDQKKKRKIHMKRNYKTVIKKYPLRSAFRKHTPYKTVQIEINETIEIPSEDETVCRRSLKRKWSSEVIDAKSDETTTDGCVKTTPRRLKRKLFKASEAGTSEKHNAAGDLNNEAVQKEDKTAAPRATSATRSHQVLKFSDDHNAITVSIVNNNNLCDFSKRKRRHRYRRKTVLQLDGAVDESTSDGSDASDHNDSSSATGTGQGAQPPLHSNLAFHIKQQSLARSSPGEEGPYKCSKCKRLYRTKDSYNRHIETCTFEIDSSTSSSEESEKVKEMDEYRTPKLKAPQNKIQCGQPSVSNVGSQVPVRNQVAGVSNVQYDTSSTDLVMGTKSDSPINCSFSDGRDKSDSTNLEKLEELCYSPALLDGPRLYPEKVPKKESKDEQDVERMPGVHRQVRIAMRRASDTKQDLPQSQSSVAPPLPSSVTGSEVFVPPAISPMKFNPIVKKSASPRRYTNVRLFKGRQGYQYRRAPPQLVSSQQPQSPQMQQQFQNNSLQMRAQQPSMPIAIQSLVDPQGPYRVTSPYPTANQYQSHINQPLPQINRDLGAGVGAPMAQVMTMVSGASVAVPQGYTLQYVGSFREGEIRAPTTSLLTYQTPQPMVVPPLVVTPQPTPVVMPQVVNTNITYTIAAPETLVINQPTAVVPVPGVQYVTQSPQQQSFQQPMIQNIGTMMSFNQPQQVSSVQHIGSPLTPIHIPVSSVPMPQIQQCQEPLQTELCAQSYSQSSMSFPTIMSAPSIQTCPPSPRNRPQAFIAPISSETSTKEPRCLKIEASPTSSSRPLFSQTPPITRSVATVAPAVFTTSSIVVSKPFVNTNTSTQVVSSSSSSPAFADTFDFVTTLSEAQARIAAIRPRPTYSYRDAMKVPQPEKKRSIEESVTEESAELPPKEKDTKASEEEGAENPDSEKELKQKENKPNPENKELQSYKLVLRKDGHSGSKFNVLPLSGPNVPLPSPEVKELRIKAKVSVGPKRKKASSNASNGRWTHSGKEFIVANKDITNDLLVNEQIPNLLLNMSPSQDAVDDPKLIDKPKAATPEPYIIFELTSEDGFKVESRHVSEVWQKVFDAVSEARDNLWMGVKGENAGTPESKGKSLSGLHMLGLTHNAVQYLLEQLPGAKDCHKYSFQFHRRPTEDDLLQSVSGCARSEAFKTRSPYDVFSWLASKHRRLPLKASAAHQEEIQLSTRRATSLELPMAMRYRHLCETAREAVGVFRSSIHGRGLFCKREIDAGEMVIEYAGQVIRSSLCDMREKYYESKGIGCYMFRIDEETVIDATMHGNAARFINHSCDPNCYSRVVDILGKKHIIIFALRRIKRSEELTYDYKFPIEEDKIPCSCGARRCRKYLN